MALKTLPDEFASDPERLARFEREAKSLALLNHPHIASIYGVEAGTPPALAMEMVEGETLAERIAAGPLPIDEALAIARQIISALEHAHDRGIVHRDLKPANIKAGARDSERAGLGAASRVDTAVSQDAAATLPVKGPSETHPLAFSKSRQRTDELRGLAGRREARCGRNATGTGDVFLIPVPPTGERWQVSVAGGAQPRWRSDGKAIYFPWPGR